MDIQTTLLTSLRKLSKQHTTETLGDRGSYLGASDIGHCPRKVVQERIAPKEHDLATLLRFKRGHMAEEIIAEVFTAAGYTNFERQVEIKVNQEGVPFLVHIDFVFTSKISKTKSILEVKSGSVPSMPYGSWESQLYAQMGAVAEQSPDYKVKGAILSIDLAAGEVGFFAGYQPNQILFQGLKTKAVEIWSAYQAMQQGEEIEIATEPSLLCGCCNHLLDCPRFAAKEVPDMIHFVEDLRMLQVEEKALKAKIEPQKRKLLEIVDKIGSIKVETYILNKRVQERKSIDMVMLEDFLSDHGQAVSDFQTSSKSSWLEIKKTKAA